MKKNILFAVMALLVAFVICCFIYRKNTMLPFKCLYTERYVFHTDVAKNDKFMTQDLRIYSKDRAYLIFDGQIEISGRKYNVKRSLFLNDGIISEGKTFFYNIKQRVTLPGDNIPDALFDKILHEYSLDENHIQIDLFNLRNKTWLIGGPYSFIGVCIRY